jgi:hypothetical protein
MKCKMTGAAGLVGAFVAGMVVTTALGGGMTGPGRRRRGSKLPCRGSSARRTDLVRIESADR